MGEKRRVEWTSTGKHRWSSELIDHGRKARLRVWRDDSVLFFDYHCEVKVKDKTGSVTRGAWCPNGKDARSTAERLLGQILDG